jgi:hypothetical protein
VRAKEKKHFGFKGMNKAGKVQLVPAALIPRLARNDLQEPVILEETGQNKVPFTLC